MAGQVKVNQVQLGDSVTATQNFVLQTNVDGTAKLARGNVGATTQDILTVDAAGKVAFPQNPVRTWQAVTRVSGTPYVAPAYDIEFRININATTNAVVPFCNIAIGASPSMRLAYSIAGDAAAAVGNITIPAGATYTITNTNVASFTCHELR